MAFNVNDYVKPVSKPFTKRITDPVVSSAARGFNTGASSIAQTTAENLVATAGVAQEIVKAQSATTTSNILSAVGDAYYAIAGVNPVRTTRADLEKNRFGRMSTNDYLKSSDPATRIGAAIKDNTVEIISVV
jgi:predicted molibdopterin-dependent oxidoreductase YjgC